MEEVDVGKELTSVDPNKELQYAELEQFQEKSGHQPSNRENNLNHIVDEEPVSLPLSSRVCMSFVRKPTNMYIVNTPFPFQLVLVGWLSSRVGIVYQQAKLRNHSPFHLP